MINKKTMLIGVVVLIVGSIFYLESRKVTPQNPQDGENADIIINPENSLSHAPLAGYETIEEKTVRYERAKEISSPDGFINVDTLSIAEFIGKKVILVDFWTYSCINCQRTLPYLNQWQEKYSDKGLLIIGLHTPEFKFEQDYNNVKKAVENFSVKYPVVLDNDYSTWQAYKNQYWPRKYLIDIDGFIVYDHIGEGAYEETERKIQELLEERVAKLDIRENIEKEIAQPEGVEAVDYTTPRSPEIYFGAARNSSLGIGEKNKSGLQTLAEPTEINPNTLYLVGDWNFTEEYAENKKAVAKIIFRYRAQKVFFVADSESGTTIEILRDGSPITSGAGRDVEKDSTVHIKESQLYRLIEDDSSSEHTLEIIIRDPGLRAFTFTFG
jgi:thiol-disulfide isomerase/thioredoxin